MELGEALLRVQTAYPRIYLACHSRHQNARTTAHKLSPRDGAILAHLDETVPVSQAHLARHMGVAKSTLSEALAELDALGFTGRRQNGRSAVVCRTIAGTQAMSAGSVLETDRLRLLLRRLTEDERARAIDGLEMLARAALKLKGSK